MNRDFRLRIEGCAEPKDWDDYHAKETHYLGKISVGCVVVVRVQPPMRFRYMACVMTGNDIHSPTREGPFDTLSEAREYIKTAVTDAMPDA